MAITYFVTSTNTEQLQAWLYNDFLRSHAIQCHYLLERRHLALINKDYLKLTLPDEMLTQAIYQKLRAASLQLQFDFFVKPQSIPTKGLIAFDMDSTFIEEEGVDEIAHTLGISAQIAEMTQQAMEGKVDFDTSFTRRIRMLKGTHCDVLNVVCDRMTISPGLAAMLPVLKNKGFKTAIISGGLDIFTQRLKEKYQLDYAFSNTVEIKDNVLTDNITFPIMNARKKRQTLSALATQLNLAVHNIIACGDGANDLPMLTYAGTGIAWRAKPVVRETIHHQINFHGFESLLFFIEDEL
ncbi:phosphoserine phosphatase SerB [Citrobacter koseri]|uniref:phosphoserine phosphatase SerB n=1 Tax=Citrobacter koseri TaxID=545 RepID=UPI00066673C9|nr:phosphoserine phosphatase SerB [Citrobacter koseri]